MDKRRPYKGLHSFTVHVYQFEVSEIHQDVDMKWLKNNSSVLSYTKSRYDEIDAITISLISTSAIKASIELLDMGYTPVRLLNPKAHD